MPDFGRPSSALGAYTYLLYKEGSTYCARKGEDGTITSNATFATLANATIAACNDGDSVAILPGTYTRTAQIDILKNDFTLIGIGKVVLASTAHICGIVCGDGTNTYSGIRVENIAIDMGNYGPTINDLHGIWMKKVNDFIVTHCDVGNCEIAHAVRSWGIIADDCVRGEISFNHVWEFSGGIIAGKTTAGTTSQGIRMIGNHVHNIDPYDCLAVYRSAGKCVVASNICHDGFYGGCIVEGGAGFRSDNTTVSGNVFHDTQYGIFVYGAQKVSISGNTCYNNTNYGINVRASANSEVTICGNTIYNSTNAGIHCGDTSQHGSITGNSITECLHGIHMEIGSSYWNISGNNIHFNDRNGILIDATHHLTVTGNTISENSQATHNTYSDVLLQNTSTVNFFIGNKFPISSATANKSKYAIEEAASTETGNVYQGNFFGTNHGTGKILIASTTSKVINNENSTPSKSITSSDSPYTALAENYVIRADATSGNITINLPSAAGITGKVYTIIRTDIVSASSTNIVTIDANSTETIDGNLTHLLFSGESVMLESDGTSNWIAQLRTQPSSRGYYLKGATANRRITGGSAPTLVSFVASSTSPAANTLWATPIIVEKTTKFDTISFRVTTLSTAGSARAGVYRDNGNMYPGSLLFDSGSIDTSTGSTSVARDTTITSSLQIFQAGVYWLAWETNSATGQYASLQTASMILGFAAQDSAMGTTASGFGYSVSHTFGALPDPYTASATLLTTTPAAGTPVVAVGLRPV